MAVVGIDLGTTNSLVGIGNNLLSSLVSSNVDIKRREQVGRDVVSEDVVSSYKTNMSMGQEGELSVECSAVILKKLAELAERRLGEQVDEAVISVPAYFSTSQREAVRKAADKAGLKVLRLINEPTAAAIYVCRDIKDLIVVYDLGGGTFDISIVDSRMGSYAVIATDGKDKGGDDLDEALAAEVFKACKVPIRYRKSYNQRVLRGKMRLAKEQIQKTKADVEVDISEFGVSQKYVLTVERYKEIVKEVFWDTVKRTMYIVNRYIPNNEKPKIVFVGGSTNCPYLKEMLLNEIDMEEIKSDINPDLIVAKGAALYADMMDKGIANDIVEDVTKRLCIEDKFDNSITVIDSNSIIPCRGTIVVDNDKKSSSLSLKLYQGDQLVAKNNAYIGELEYNYGRMVEAGDGLVEVTVNIDLDGIVSLSAQELLKGEVSKQEIRLKAR